MATQVLFGVFALLLLIKVPIPFALGLSTIFTVVFVSERPLLVVVQRMSTSMESFALIAVPLFVLAGEIMNQSGAGKRLVDFANILIGHITGGLAHANIIGSMFFGGISGAASADTAAIGSIMIPAMSEGGYSKTFSTIVTISSSPIGNIIPPSITMVIYGWLAGIPISRLFIAGIVPGVLIGILLMIVSYIISKRNNYGVKKEFNLSGFWEKFVSAFPALLMPIIILGGMFIGMFTATEAAAVAVVYGLFISIFVYKEPGLSEFPNIFIRACKISGSIMLLIAMTEGFGWVMSLEQIPLHLSLFFTEATPTATLFLFATILISLIVGMFLTPTAALVLLVPILLPVAETFIIDPLHFGMVLVSALVVGHVTPPVGLCLYVGSNISGIPISELIKPVMPFFITLVLLSVLIAIFPEMVMFLPELLF